jgi:hypothetical protein
MKSLLRSSFVALILLPTLIEASDTKQPEEFGKVVFLRDYAAALKQAKTDKKPLFLLFDEIPG